MMRMTLPVSYARERALVYAMKLNLLEALEWVRSHLNGAWSVDERSNLVFTSFIPMAGYKKGELANMALSFAVRSKWVAKALEESESDHSSVGRMLQ